jgi:hypothetical protein
MTNVSDNKSYGYAIPKNLSGITGFERLSVNTTTVIQ